MKLRTALLTDSSAYLRVSIAIVIALAVIAMAVWLPNPFVETQASAPPQDTAQGVSQAQGARYVEIAPNAYVFTEPYPVASFRLLTQDDRPFDNSALKGKWSLLFFGYTHCPDVCPTTLAVFDQIQRALGETGARDVQFVFVTVDPARDTPQHLKKYVASFNPELLGVTGDSAEIARLSQSMGVMYEKVAGGSDQDYFMNHSTAVQVTDPAGRLHGIFGGPHVAQNIVRAFQQMRHAGEAAQLGHQSAR